MTTPATGDLADSFEELAAGLARFKVYVAAVVAMSWMVQGDEERARATLCGLTPPDRRKVHEAAAAVAQLLAEPT